MIISNYETPSSFWCLGNLKIDGAENIIKTYQANGSVAQHVIQNVPVSEMVKKYGNYDSMRLFGEWDYKNYLLQKYCQGL